MQFGEWSGAFKWVIKTALFCRAWLREKWRFGAREGRGAAAAGASSNFEGPKKRLVPLFRFARNKIIGRQTLSCCVLRSGRCVGCGVWGPPGFWRGDPETEVDAPPGKLVQRMGQFQSPVDVGSGYVSPSALAFSSDSQVRFLIVDSFVSRQLSRVACAFSIGWAAKRTALPFLSRDTYGRRARFRAFVFCALY